MATSRYDQPDSGLEHLGPGDDLRPERGLKLLGREHRDRWWRWGVRWPGAGSRLRRQPDRGAGHRRLRRRVASGAIGGGILIESTGDQISNDVFSGNQDGILIGNTTANTVGGSAASAAAGPDRIFANEFSDNQVGVHIDDAAVNTISGAATSSATGPAQVYTNTLGGNQVGILIDDSADSTIGGTPGNGNTFGGNTSAGVSITGSSATGNLLVNNLIGTGGAATSPPGARHRSTQRGRDRHRRRRLG